MYTITDDGIEFAKNWWNYVGKQVTLDVVPNLPHGFLCLACHPDAKQTINMVLSRIKAGLEVPSCNDFEPLIILNLLMILTRQLQNSVKPPQSS